MSESGITYLDDQHVLYDYTSSDGKVEHCCDEQKAIAILLEDDVVFVSGQDYIAPWDPKEKTCGIVVNCNDVFYWACADAESLPQSEIRHLYELWLKNKKFGADKWCCLRRNMQPQVPLVKMMKEEGFWDAELEALPKPEPS